MWTVLKLFENSAAAHQLAVSFPSCVFPSIMLIGQVFYWDDPGYDSADRRSAAGQTAHSAQLIVSPYTERTEATVQNKVCCHLSTTVTVESIKYSVI